MLISTAHAQTPTAIPGDTIPTPPGTMPTDPTPTVSLTRTPTPTTGPLCPPPTVTIVGEGAVEQLAPPPGQSIPAGDRIQLEALNGPYCRLEYWEVNGETIEREPTPEGGEWQFSTTLVVEMPNNCTLSVVAIYTDPARCAEWTVTEPPWIPSSTPTPLRTSNPSEPIPVPEPVTVILFGSGIAALAVFTRRRRHRVD